jgi:hypothetical protein
VLTARSLWAQPCESSWDASKLKAIPACGTLISIEAFRGLEFVSIGTKNKDMLAPQELAETANQGRKKKASRGVQVVINAARVD